jgi:hypothetical protein
MSGITLHGVTFRWDGDELIITTSTGQERLSGDDAALLLDFLQRHQQALYGAEQSRGLPAWARQPGRFVNGGLIEQQSRALEKKQSK